MRVATLRTSGMYSDRRRHFHEATARVSSVWRIIVRSVNTILLSERRQKEVLAPSLPRRKVAPYLARERPGSRRGASDFCTTNAYGLLDVICGGDRGCVATSAAQDVNPIRGAP
jgi:hypothetical protein